ncbi:TetR family transcriptional regulator [Antricoccus suffuscus]|uniref:TetR family transcriptional regulator n=1 Tax=Antricoccus suffuscus TaxID=1629062 RepID=A0A2T0ZXR7_9ACTN|nr:TetR/AcrR family transcriptional regulator [Antricoccus suffuscus]PRZ40868.1 TetR family transcriptional regulator [Antricoccus suffuscus]
MKDRRRSIAEAAEQVFAVLGYAQTSIGAIAEASGVTRPTVYSYFDSKYEIFRTVAESVRDEVLATQENAGDDPRTILQRTTSEYLNQWVRHYGVLTVIAHEALSDPQFAKLLDDVLGRPGNRHRKFIERLAAEGRASPRLSAQEIVHLHVGATMRMAQVVVRNPNREKECAKTLFNALLIMINLHD